jgi:putative tricarboxylic transport membrane protein
MIAGTSMGIVIGALPGMSATTGMALLLPVTFSISVECGLLMLAGVYCGAVYGGSISAILVGIPGTAASIPTAFDGFPMAKDGRAREALLYALYGSAIGGTLSALVLMFLTPVIARFAMKFGPPEMFAVGIWGMFMVSSVVGKDVVKGLIMAMIGLIVSTVGADPVNGVPRMTFDNVNFIGGIEFVSLVLGTLALPRVLEMVETLRTEKVFYKALVSRKWYLMPNEIFRHWASIVRSAVIGLIVGIAPAAGPTIASVIGYNESKRSSKYPEKFGTGIPDGVVASETANNASTGGDMVLTLALGVPGSAACAVFIGALIMKGLQPGPQLMRNNPVPVFTFFAGFLLVNILFFIIGHLFIQLGGQVVRTPLQILAPCILVFCVLGAYASSNSLLNVNIMLISGLAAYVMGKMRFPMPPFILGLILGPLIEANFWASLLISYNDYFVFFKRPLAAGFMILAIMTLIAPTVYGWVKAKKRRAA